MKKTIWLTVLVFVALITVLAFAGLTGATLAHLAKPAPPVNAEICAALNVKGPIEHAEVETRDGAFGFDLELADTAQGEACGLMGRMTLSTTGGMLFDFHEPQRVAMWMHDTKLPLDMIFLSQEGVVLAVLTHLEPMTDDMVMPGMKVQAVIELNAGTAEAIGVAPGDKVEHRIFQMATR